MCAVSANCWALFFMSSVFSSARPNRSPRSFKAWLAFCTALVTLSAAEWRMLFPEEAQQEHQRPPRLTSGRRALQGLHTCKSQAGPYGDASGTEEPVSISLISSDRTCVGRGPTACRTRANADASLAPPSLTQPSEPFSCHSVC